jgi:hypothetical protein
VKQSLPIVSPLLQELVNYSTHALIRCATSATGARKRDEDIAVLVLYRHIIEMTDGIEVLLSQGCSVPAIPLLRSSFEALLSLQYILESESEYGQRSLAWLVGYVHERVDTYEHLDPETNKGGATQKLIEDDEIASEAALPPVEDLRAHKANLQSLLTKPHLQPIEKEYRAYQERLGKRKIKWYQLFNGPQNLYELAKRLKKGGLYEILYRPWSTTMHAQDLQPFITQASDGSPAIAGLRSDLRHIKEMARFATPIMLEATCAILRKLRPGEDSFERWYKREVERPYVSIV